MKRLAFISVISAALGGFAFVLFFFQPWSTCADDDVSAGCPGGWEAVARLISLLMVLLGIAVLIMLGFRSDDTPRNKQEGPPL